ncbi:MAG: LacI family DNA-binding transcriptional regulator [Janthinobacterium lividum]
MSKNAVTIKDVAARGGVSKTAVSYILSGRQTGVRISDDTRKRVLAAAQELGYHPNALARGLARRQTDTLALVMQFPAVFSGWSGFTNELMHGATDAATALGFDLMLHTKGTGNIEQDVAALTDGRADGALLLRDRNDPLSNRLTERSFPFVQIFSHSTSPDACFVDCDNVAGAKMAVNHLWSLGHRRIGHVAGSSNSAAAADRLHGYRDALEAHGIMPRDDWECSITYAGSDFAPFVEMMSRPGSPTALFVWSDDVANRAIRVLNEQMGLNVPQDISVIGFDGTQMCDQTTPRLSSIRQPIYKMAAHGVKTLVSLLRHEPLSERNIVFTPTLELRDSSSFAPQPSGRNTDS